MAPDRLRGRADRRGLSAEPLSDLLAVLERSRALGFLGPGLLQTHIDHALAFDADPASKPPARALDLGAGGGVPGLVLALLRWPECDWVMLDSIQRRCEFLREAIEELDLVDRVSVYQGRAEEAGRVPELRHTFDLVTSRGFGAPAITAECGAPLLALGGMLVVSEPPGGAPDRWTAAGLIELGIARVEVVQMPGAAMAVFEARKLAPDRYPRRVGIPTKRPLF